MGGLGCAGVERGSARTLAEASWAVRERLRETQRDTERLRDSESSAGRLSAKLNLLWI